MTSRSPRIAAVLAALLTFATALFLTACSSSATEDHATHTTDEPVVTGEPAGFNADDVAFATNMIPHHQQAVEMSALVADRSTNQQLIALADQISAAQQPEINALRVFLVQWNENPQDSAGGHQGHGEMAGMVDEATMTKLESLKGAEFDKLWLESMISHHQGAIEMAKAEVANGKNVDAKNMAQTIIDAQQAEIAQMNQMLKDSGQ
jgi:uncharacterized protein (DUF305 family)